MNGQPTYHSPVPEDRFPRASLYRAWGNQDALREPRPPGRHFPFSERHLQCVWYDPVLRPGDLRTAEGEAIIVDDPGTWNLEAGPDFLGAVLRVGPGRRRLCGDVELHISPAGWQQHGHTDDPRFRSVRAHVTYFPGTVAPDALPPGTLQLSLRNALSRDPAFSFETIDVTAYPFAGRAQVPPCSKVLKGWAREEKQSMLDAAGEERLRRKAERMAGRIAESGPGQVLYEEVLAALGYKHNKLAFRRLAESVPLDELRDASGNDPDIAYALLAGVAGLLPPEQDRAWDPTTRAYVRRLWDAWWKHRDQWESRKLPTGSWRLSSLRPANHPRRRMMAAARLFTRTNQLDAVWSSATDLEQAHECLEDLDHPYWSRHLSFGGKPQAKPIALVGRDRISAILTNVFVPYRGTLEGDHPIPAGLLDQLPREDDNQIVRQTAHFLFGRDHSPSLYNTGLRRQGLVQIFHDFCLIDRSRCATCPFPNALRNYHD